MGHIAVSRLPTGQPDPWTPLVGMGDIRRYCRLVG